MIVLLSPVSPRNSGIVSHSLSLRLRTYCRLTAIFALTAGLIAGSDDSSAAQTAHFAGTQATLASGFNGVGDAVVDGSGNLYVADTLNNASERFWRSMELFRYLL